MVKVGWPRTVQEVAEELQGSCKALYEVLECHNMEGAQDDERFTSELDSLVFHCDQCGWWFETSEMTDREDCDWTCRDCADEGGEHG